MTTEKTVPTPEELVASIEGAIAKCRALIAERQADIVASRALISDQRARIAELTLMRPRKPRAKKAPDA